VQYTFIIVLLSTDLKIYVTLANFYDMQ